MTDDKRRRIPLFSRPALWLVIFMTALILFIYPFLSSASTWNCRRVFLFLYCAWGLIIIILVFIGFSIPRPGSSNTGKDRSGS
jgi:Na+/melibiose symporter-like transporter